MAKSADAIVYSLVESGKANGIEPFAYLQHMRLRILHLEKSYSHQKLEFLMPWAPIASKISKCPIPMPTQTLISINWQTQIMEPDSFYPGGNLSANN